MHRTSYRVPHTPPRFASARRGVRWTPWVVLATALLLGLTYGSVIFTQGGASPVTGEPRTIFYPFTGSANINLTPTHGFVGTSVTVSGYGFANDTNVSITFNSTQVGTCLTGNSTSADPGNFSCAFVVPSVSASSYYVNATNATDVANATFVVDPSTTGLSAPNGFVGSPVTATGVGFVPNASLQLTLGSSSLPCQPGGT